MSREIAEGIGNAAFMIQRLRKAEALAKEQCYDSELWYVYGSTKREAYLQEALRSMHEAIEGKTQEECIKEFTEEEL